MTATSTNIANIALGHVAVQITLGDLDTDKSSEAATCRVFYEPVRQEMLRAFPWPFAKKTVTLAPVAGPNPPATTEWQMSYRLPSDVLRVRRILSGSRSDTMKSRVKYLLGRDDGGGLIYCDPAPVAPQMDPTNTIVLVPALPLLEYTMLLTDESQYPADFVTAMAWKLAWYIAPRVTKGDEFKLGATAKVEYKLAFEEARATAMNEEQPDLTPESEFTLERDDQTLLPPTPMIRSI